MRVFPWIGPTLTSPSALPPWPLPVVCFVCVASLCQGQIPNDVNEDTLKQLFSTYGLVTESKILVDKIANKPKGPATRHAVQQQQWRIGWI